MIITLAIRRWHPYVYMRRWSTAGVSSLVELRSLGRVHGRRAAVQAARPRLQAAVGSKGTTSFHTAWALTASQELPEWH